MTRLIGLLIVLLAAPAAPAVGAAEAVIDAELWDPNSGEFTTTGSLADTRFCHGATLLDAGHVLIAGGRSSTGDGRYTTTAEVWDPDLGRFRAAGALLEPRCWPGVVTLADGRVLVVGGSYGSDDDKDAHASAEIWDPLTERFEPTGSMAHGRRGHTTTLLPDGRVLVVGGKDAGERLDSAEVWDPDSGAFSDAGTLLSPRSYHTATLLPDGRVLVVGGNHEDEAEVWDPTTEAFGRSGRMTVGRRDLHTASLLADGSVLIVGWETGEEWVPDTGDFTAAGALDRRRFLHTATALPDGRVLVVGGFHVDGPTETVEVWDPQTRAFQTIAPLNNARSHHSATLLPDGRVLVVGGVNASGD